MILKALLFMAGVAGIPNHTAAPDVQERFCPADAPRYLGYVRDWFATPETLWFREQFGLLGIVSGDIRPLTDPQDAEICERIASTITLDQAAGHRKLWRGFQAGEFYIMLVTTERARGDFHHAGGTGLIILNAEMRVVAASS